MDQSLKILIIDDEEHVLVNLCDFLNYKNYDVTSASDGLEGLKLFENDQQGFDLIITDIVMPKISESNLYANITTYMPLGALRSCPFEVHTDPLVLWKINIYRG
jgi:YesN/AraC family two-component response regulator